VRKILQKAAGCSEGLGLNAARMELILTGVCDGVHRTRGEGRARLLKEQNHQRTINEESDQQPQERAKVN
jgi:hypothetical protein